MEDVLCNTATGVICGNSVPRQTHHSVSDQVISSKKGITVMGDVLCNTATGVICGNSVLRQTNTTVVNPVESTESYGGQIYLIFVTG